MIGKITGINEMHYFANVDEVEVINGKVPEKELIIQRTYKRLQNQLGNDNPLFDEIETFLTNIDSIGYIFYGRDIIALVNVLDRSDKLPAVVGMSTLHPYDKPNPTIGKTLAFKRAIDREIKRIVGNCDRVNQKIKEMKKEARRLSCAPKHPPTQLPPKQEQVDISQIPSERLVDELITRSALVFNFPVPYSEFDDNSNKYSIYNESSVSVTPSILRGDETWGFDDDEAEF